MTTPLQAVHAALKQLLQQSKTPDGLALLNRDSQGICSAIVWAIRETKMPLHMYCDTKDAWREHYPRLFREWPESSGFPRYPVEVDAFPHPTLAGVYCRTAPEQFHGSNEMFGGSKPYGQARLRLLAYLVQEFEVLAALPAPAMDPGMRIVE